ncbi:hypothetical protein [Flexivirga oryzae]|uniref:Uncharacterized protein n=1 Tax=Flexivirga oryzae TaxID=1794944 RepID=A0A839NA52_9MICO|nr:hypothetical protein [Flexivirga oryzae]MBB2894103.1 hypothetical protein [Flexivirga oryzae]MBB2894107.1 hypothetical protein [Flexivirga oryzae]
MNTTQSLNGKHTHQGRSEAGFSGKVRAFFREQQDAHELLLEKQAPWLSRR